MTDDNGCVVAENVVVDQPDTLTAAIFGVIDSDCFGAAGRHLQCHLVVHFRIHSWDDPGRIGATAQNLPAGTWTVTVTDDNGCIASNRLTSPSRQHLMLSLLIMM